MALSGLASFLNFAVYSVYPLIDLVSTNTYHKVTQQDKVRLNIRDPQTYHVPWAMAHNGHLL